MFHFSLLHFFHPDYTSLSLFLLTSSTYARRTWCDPTEVLGMALEVFAVSMLISRVSSLLFSFSTPLISRMYPFNMTVVRLRAHTLQEHGNPICLH